MVKVLVLIKKTPDTETKIVLGNGGGSIDTTNIKYIINPYDEHAIEEALQIKAKMPNLEVVVASFGSSDAKELIIKGLAMGADRGVLVNNAGLEAADSLTTAKVLAAMVKTEKPDFIMCGKQAIDDDNMHVGSMLAELLDWPHINVINKLTIDGNSGTAEREVEGGQIEAYKFSLPIILGANKALNTPRFTSLPGIMKAKKKPLDEKKISDLGLDLNQLISGVKTKIVSYKPIPGKTAGKIFKGEDVKVMADKVATLLREEAKVL